MKPYKIGKNNGRRWTKISLFIAVAAIIVGAAGYFGIKSLYENNLKPVDMNATDDIIYTLQTGTTPAQAAEELYNMKLIRSARAFNQYVRSRELAEGLKAGTYRLKQSMSVQEIVAVLTEGRVAEDLFTILPGQSLSRIKQRFISAGFASGEVDAAMNPALYADHPALVDKPAAASLEGFLYPDSYQLLKGQTTVRTIVTQSLDEMAEALSPDIRAGIASHGLSVYDGIKLASIVEGEVSQSNPDDRPRAAQVFISRLNNGMPLESNATDQAAEERGPDFDTYNIPGLPPEPVSNVTKSALQAVAAPSNTDFLYFVSGRDCVTRFSRTLSEHEALQVQHGVARPEDNCR